jgi:hypothetical protein
MSVIQIRKAKREGARLVVSLSGVSSSGKTHTALLIALGLANGNPEKVGFIDTENRRGSLYSDIYAKLDGPMRTDKAFLIGDLYPPFSPGRYVEAIHAFQQAGVEVLIIDSATHEWEGQGGCDDIANAGDPRLPNWNKAKAEHKRFMNAALQCDMHIIFCVRAREKAKPEKQTVNGKEKLVFVDLGLQPIQEKNFMFEMTVSLMVHDQGKRREIMKCPAELRPIFETAEQYIGVKQGKALRDWVDGGAQLDPKVEAYRNKLISNAEQGEVHIEDCWKKTPADIRKSLGEDFHKTLTASAKEYDAQRAAAKQAVEDAKLPGLASPGASSAVVQEVAPALTGGTAGEGVTEEQSADLAAVQSASPSSAPASLGDVF